MNNLRKYVRNILLEMPRKRKPRIKLAAIGARNLNDFTSNTYIGIKKINKKEYRIFYAHIDEDGDLAETKSYHSELFPGYDQESGRRGGKNYSAGVRPFPRGYIIVEKKTSDEGTKLGKCGGAWSIQMIRAAKGWGPLLYDIAMEFLTKKFGTGLMADRLTVSNSAAPVWDYYENKRKDASIKSHQMDDLAGTLKKKSKKDLDYKAYKGLKAGDKCNQSKLGPNWIKNPRSRRWTKEPIVINELEKLGLIHYI